MSDGYLTNYYADTYPGLIVRLVFQRKLHYHLLQTYCPSSSLRCFLEQPTANALRIAPLHLFVACLCNE